MNTSSLTAIIDKVRKLRALTTSANVHEAAAAAAAADRLLQEHSIAEAELESTSDEVANEAPCEAEHLYAAWGRAIPGWENILSTTLARHYDCRMVLSWRDAGSRRVARIFGRPSDVETARYQWVFLRTEITRLVELHGKGRGRSWRVSFCRGATRSIIDALDSTKNKVRQQASSSALVLFDDRKDALDKLVTETFPDLQTTRVTSTIGDEAGFLAGKRAGANIHQRSSLGAGGVRMLGKGGA